MHSLSMGWMFFLPIPRVRTFAYHCFYWIYQFPSLAVALISGILICWAAADSRCSAEHRAELENCC